MREPANVSRPVSPFVVTHGNLDNSEIQFRGAKKQVEVAERIKLAKITAALGDSIVVVSVKYFSAAECVFYRLSQHAAQQKGKKLITDQVQKAHRFGILGIDQS